MIILNGSFWENLKQSIEELLLNTQETMDGMSHLFGTNILRVMMNNVLMTQIIFQEIYTTCILTTIRNIWSGMMVQAIMTILVLYLNQDLKGLD